MSSRRDFMIGAACLAGAGAAYALVPRRRVVLMERDNTLQRIVPRAFSGWTSQDVSDLVAPKIEGSLVSKLYGETVGRVYTRGSPGPEVMMLMAYGDTQSDDLQLHRPEICYPAFGFAISHSAPINLDLGDGVSIPSRRLVADAPGRREAIVYWSRLGEYLPLDRKEQQLDRLQTAMRGEVSDGLLARFSVLGADPASGVAAMSDLIPALIRAVPAKLRAVLIGTQRAVALRERGV